MTGATRDVVVIGAGPAGLLAARDLAAQGHSVVVVEEHASIGYPVHCTGLLGLDAFDELSLPRTSIRAVMKQARFHGPSGDPITVATDHIVAAVIDRGDFDAALAHEAAAAGVEFILGRRAETIEVQASAVRVHFAAGTDDIVARTAVLACGANYRFNRMLGLGVPPTLVQSAQAEVPFPAAETIDVFLGRSVAPDGFGWLVPFARDGAHCARLGVMCTEDARSHFSLLAKRIWADWSLAGAPPEPRLKALPLSPVQRSYGDRVLAVGDAAGIVKPTTGGGIYYGLLSGSLAASALDSCLRADRLSASALASYERDWRKRLGPDIKAGLAFRRIATGMSDETIVRLVDLARVDGVVPLLKQHGNFNWHRAAVIALLRHKPFRRALVSSFWG